MQIIFQAALGIGILSLAFAFPKNLPLTQEANAVIEQTLPPIFLNDLPVPIKSSIFAELNVSSVEVNNVIILPISTLSLRKEKYDNNKASIEYLSRIGLLKSFSKDSSNKIKDWGSLENQPYQFFVLKDFKSRDSKAIKQQANKLVLEELKRTRSTNTRIPRVPWWLLYSLFFLIGVFFNFIIVFWYEVSRNSKQKLRWKLNIYIRWLFFILSWSVGTFFILNLSDIQADYDLSLIVKAFAGVWAFHQPFFKF
ncbi:MAG: hypothetical protein JWQ35_1620 [Bacteriovoracaceae bacterium]|nr:hypothetical protein [Bacteriovoracaceae bacterium]